MKKILYLFVSMIIIGCLSACGKTENSIDAGQSAVVVDDDVEVVVSDTGESDTEIFINEPSIEDSYFVEEIIYQTESQKVQEKNALTYEDIEMLDKVPNSTVTYVAVDGLGNVYGMGVHFQGYSVSVGAQPKEGYHYVGCESDTIEFKYKPSEFWGRDLASFLVPESGEHIIYVYFAPNE